MYRFYSVVYLCIIYNVVSSCGPLETTNYTDRIDPLLEWNNSVADASINVPFGMIQLSPITYLDSINTSAKGHFNQNHSQFVGFEHFNKLRHLYPEHPDLRFRIRPKQTTTTAQRTKDKELVATGRYALLQSYPNFAPIRVEGSASNFTSLIEYQLASNQAHILDIECIVSNENKKVEITRPDSSYIQIKLQNDKSTSLYSLIRLSSVPEELIWTTSSKSLKLTIGETISSKGIGKLELTYAKQPEKRNIYVNSAFSRISHERVKSNFEMDSKGWWLEGVVEANKAEWRTHLSKIRLQGGTLEDQILFYSSHYRALKKIATITESAGVFPKADGFSQDLSTKRYIWIGEQPSNATAVWLRLSEAATLQTLSSLFWGKVNISIPETLGRVMLAAGDDHILGTEITSEIQRSAIRTISSNLNPKESIPLLLCGISMPGGGYSVRINKPSFDYYKIHIGGTAYLEYTEQTTASDPLFEDVVLKGWKSPSQ